MNFGNNRSVDFTNKFFEDQHLTIIFDSKSVLEVGIGSGMSLLELSNTYLDKKFFGVTLNDFVAEGYGTSKKKNYLRKIYSSRFKKKINKFPYVKYRNINKKILLKKKRDYLFSIGCLGYQNINLISFSDNYISFFKKFFLHIATIDTKKNFKNLLLYKNDFHNQQIYISNNSANNSNSLDIVYTNCNNSIKKAIAPKDIYKYKYHNNFKSFMAILRIKFFITYLERKTFLKKNLISIFSFFLYALSRLYIDIYLGFINKIKK